MTDFSRCPACHQHSRFLFRERDRNRRTTSETFSYYRCDACGVVFVWPIPVNPDVYYPPSYHDEVASAGQQARRLGHEREKVEFVKRFSKTGELLEIGPGRGGFASLALQAGFRVDAIEMDAGCCGYLQEVLGIRAYQSSRPREVMAALGRYDVIALWQVLEHLQDPWGVLEEARRHLSTGGVIIVSTPNPEAVQFRLFGHRWVHTDVPRHLQLIPFRALVDQMRALGVGLISDPPVGVGNVLHNRYGWQGSLQNLAPLRWSDNAIVKWTGRILGSVISLAAAPWDSGGRRGSTYTAAFRR